MNSIIANLLCPICGQISEEIILLNTKEKEDSKFNELHKQNIGFSTKACEKCIEHKEEVVYCVGVDETKSDFSALEKIYRTGQIVGIKKDSELAKELEKYIITLSDGTKLCFIDEEMGKEIKLFN